MVGQTKQASIIFTDGVSVVGIMNRFESRVQTDLSKWRRDCPRRYTARARRDGDDYTREFGIPSAVSCVFLTNPLFSQRKTTEKKEKENKVAVHTDNLLRHFAMRSRAGDG